MWERPKPEAIFSQVECEMPEATSGVKQVSQALRLETKRGRAGLGWGSRDMKHRLL